MNILKLEINISPGHLII